MEVEVSEMVERAVGGISILRDCTIEMAAAVVVFAG